MACGYSIECICRSGIIILNSVNIKTVKTETQLVDIDKIVFGFRPEPRKGIHFFRAAQPVGKVPDADDLGACRILVIQYN